MPQTIALQRGEVTLSNNTNTLLFTNTSSGTSTRMMVGYLSWTSDFSTVYGSLGFGVLRSGASSPNFSMFAATGGAGYRRTVTLSPSNTRTGWHGQDISTVEYSPLMSNSSAGLIGATPLEPVVGSPYNGFYNTDVMLGPSDAVYCGWLDNGGGARAAIVQYCFVLVTE
jgi:hypothetical protein